MPKGKADFAQTAHNVFLQSIGEAEHVAPPQVEGKDAAAVSLGSRGGKARAAKLTAEQKKAIGQQAAAKRWSKKG